MRSAGFLSCDRAFLATAGKSYLDVNNLYLPSTSSLSASVAYRPGFSFCNSPFATALCIVRWVATITFPSTFNLILTLPHFQVLLGHLLAAADKISRFLAGMASLWLLMLLLAALSLAQSMDPLNMCTQQSTAPSCTLTFTPWMAPQIEPKSTYYEAIVTQSLNVSTQTRLL